MIFCFSLLVSILMLLFDYEFLGNHAIYYLILFHYSMGVLECIFKRACC